MAVPASGMLSLVSIRKEFGVNNYNGNMSSISNVGLFSLSTGRFGTINTANASTDRPNESAPHAMSEFYSYDHDKVAISYTSFSVYYGNSSTIACGEGAEDTLYHLSTETYNAEDTIWYQDSSGDEEADSYYYRIGESSQGYYYDGGDKEAFSCGKSERRLKYNIEFIGDSPIGIPMYHFNYKNEEHGKGRFVGTMVDDLERLGFEKALIRTEDGIFVNYDKIDVPFHNVTI